MRREDSGTSPVTSAGAPNQQMISLEHSSALKPLRKRWRWDHGWVQVAGANELHIVWSLGKSMSRQTTCIYHLVHFVARLGKVNVLEKQA